jgi:hypothetical protein
LSTLLVHAACGGLAAFGRDTTTRRDDETT